MKITPRNRGFFYAQKYANNKFTKRSNVRYLFHLHCVCLGVGGCLGVWVWVLVRSITQKQNLIFTPLLIGGLCLYIHITKNYLINNYKKAFICEILIS